MPTESGTTIAELDQLWPLGGDPILEGDNHLRLIKDVLKKQFPGEAGEGLALAISATEAELNYLVGVTSNIQEQIDAITNSNETRFPIGHLLFTVVVDDPSTYGYPGAWALIEEGVAFNNATSVSDPFIDTVQGDDDVVVPVPEHNHTMGHTHTRGTMEITGGFQQDTGSSSQTFRAFSGAIYGASTGQESKGVGTTGTANSNNGIVNFAGSRSWTGNTSQPSAGSTGTSGAASATLNVKGKNYTLLCWKRIA